MARYHFHLKDGHPLPDRDGAELPDLTSAKREALTRLTRFMLEADEHAWADHDWQVDVTDQSGLTQFSMLVVTTEAPALLKQDSGN